MRAIILFTLSILAQVIYALYIPNDQRSTRPIAGTVSHPRHDIAKLTKHAAKAKVPSIEGTRLYHAPSGSVASLNKRESAPYLFDLGRTKGYYELHGEKATDHLYDVKEGTVVGIEIVTKKCDELMDQMRKSVGAPRKNV